MPLIYSLNRKEDNKARLGNVPLMHECSDMIGEKTFVTNYRSIF